MEPTSVNRFKIPAGTLVINTGFVIALIWSQATTTEVQRSFDVRLHTVEAAAANHTSYESRISVIESSQVSQDKSYEALKDDIVKRLDRIEAKLDKMK